MIGPKPLVEEHYHIQELIDRQEKRAGDRTYHQNRIKSLEDRDLVIKDAKLVCLTDFWCDSCVKDFKSVAIKQIEVDWSNTSQNIAFYKTKCWCGKWCIRFITDKHRDGFWTRSRLVNLDKGNHYNDTVQPHETGFNLLYKKI